MNAASKGQSPVDGARRRCYRWFIATLVMAFLTSQFGTYVTATTWRRLAVALLSAASVAALCWAGVCFGRYTRSGAARYLGLASSDLPRSREDIRGLVRQESAARYGQAAFPHLQRRGRLARAGLATIGGFLLAYFVYANVSHDSLPAIIAAVATVGACMLIARITRRETELALQAMEQAMGGHTMTARSTTWQPDQYVAWCLAHDIEPYPNGRPAFASPEGA